MTLPWRRRVVPPALPGGRRTELSGVSAQRGRTDDLLADLFRAPLEQGYARAAARREDTGAAPPAWGRVVRGGAFVVIGFLLAVAYHQAMTAAPSTGRARDNLVADVRARQQRADDLQRNADDLRGQVDRARDAALADSGAAGRLQQLAAGTGTAKVTGDGVVVRVLDAPAQVDPVTGKQVGDNLGIVLDHDLQDIANGLWQAGAEAVAVNGQRLTSTSTIRAAGGVILVDFRPVTSPYEVSAIGSAELTDTFGKSATARRFGRYVDAYRMQFSVKSKGGLVLPAAAEPPLRYAHPPSPSTSPAGSSPVRSAQPSPSPTGGR